MENPDDGDPDDTEVNGVSKGDNTASTIMEEPKDRMERAFARVPREKWAVFTDASEIGDVPGLLIRKNKEAAPVE
jgi:hypothetical protein